MNLPPFDRHRIEIRLAKPVTFPFEHGGVLRGLVSRALGRHRLPPGMLPFACESGRVRYHAGDAYAIGLTLVGEARGLAGDLIAGLERLGGARPGTPAPVLGGNFAVERASALPAVDLEAEASAVAGAPSVALRLLAPLRLERPPELKRRGAGFLDRDCFPADFFLDRLWRRLFFLAHGRYPEAAEREARQPALPGAEADAQGLLWSDLPVRGTRSKARPYTLGGARGTVILSGAGDHWHRVLAAGAHLHAGSSTAYGFGRYAVTPAGASRLADDGFRPARSLLERAGDRPVLQQALQHVLDNLDRDRLERATDPEAVLPGLARELAAGTYRPRPLDGYVQRKDDGGPRPLAVPPLRDRVAQRAAVEVLAPAVDTLLEDSSFAYRRGFSRQGAARAIEAAYAEGYRYVLDADIRAFFDLVDWSILYAKLEALFPGEPLLEVMRAWVESPVVFDGRRIERRRGLPQGSPISPLLSNLYLDTFDEALLAEGFRLIRFADDFVILTKDPEDARRAKGEAEEELARLRLELNQDETAVRSIDDGFSYLGYLFVRSMVVERDKDTAETASRPPRRLDAGDVPPGSWLASVPLERIEALLEGRRSGADERRAIERVPLAHAAALAHGRWPLYVTTPQTRVFLRQREVVLEADGGEPREIPLAAVSHAVFIGRVRATVPVLRGLARKGVPSFFCRADGTLEAVFGPHRADWRLWLEQARFAENERSRLAFAAAVVAARLRNLAAIAVRFGWDGAAEAAAEMRRLAKDAGNKTTCEAVTGLEGRGSALAFGALGRSLPEAWGFEGRARRPPPDPVNAMLSFGYTLLHNHAGTALVEAGLDPRIGLMHRPHGAHDALASDLMEELRHLVESLAWSLIRRRQLTPGDFRASPDGAYPALLTPDGRRTFLHAFERRLTTEFTPEDEEEPMSYRTFLARQARRIRDLIERRRPLYEPLVLRA